MDDLATAQHENENLRKIRGRLLQWDAEENGLATLSVDQLECLETINGIWQEREIEAHANCKETYETVPTLNESTESHYLSGSVSLRDLQNLPKGLESTHEFLLWYDRVHSEIQQHCDEAYYKYLQQLELRGKECNRILEQIDLAMEKLNTLNVQYTLVANKTSALNSASEKLIDEQQKLQELSNEIQRRLHYFNQVEVLHQRLQSPTLSVPSDSFRDCLDKIDACLEYLKANPKFKDSSGFIVKYKHCLSKAISLIKNYVNTIMSQATEATLHPKMQQQQSSVSNVTTGSTSTDAAFALFYGKYQSCSAKIKRVSQMVEERVKACSEYEQLLNDIQQNYLNERASIMSPAVNKAIMELKASHKGDHCTLMRSTCAFLVNVSQDEYRLFFNFFSMPSEQLNSYLEGLCTILYDTMRPFIIHINHLETLAEICSILRIEMLEEHVQQSPESLEAFGNTTNQMLQDVQERLVFRAHLYLQSDILNYNPSAGDLAYPDKLEMMESIALSLQESSVMRRSDSRASLVSYASTESVETQAYKTRNMNSPADLHGMWYPTVRRTLVCLSRLYRCVDRPIFQGLSQDALRLCIQSVSKAAVKIAAAKTPIDGELFEIKHLLILREQIAPFRVDFTVKETSLDFSKVKTAAFGLLQKRKQLFSMGSNNALLEFLLEGTPQIKEHLLDSRKEVDRQLKTICEQFIKDSVEMLVGPLIAFLDKAQNLLSADTTNTTRAATETPTKLITEKSTSSIPAKFNYALRQSAWAAPQKISSIIQETQRLIKNKLPPLQRSMQLYLSSRDTEFIIFRPIRNNIIQTYVKLEQLLTSNGYTNDDMIITSCPSAEQVSILLSSASILATEGIVNFSAGAQQRKISSSSNESIHHLNPPVVAATTSTNGNTGMAITRKPSYDKVKHSFETQVMENLTEVPEPISSTASPTTISPTPTAEEVNVKSVEEEVGEGEEKIEKDMYEIEASGEDRNEFEKINPTANA